MREQLRSCASFQTGGQHGKGPKQFDELFYDTLKDIYFAEKKILATLTKMAKAARSPELQKAFEKHRGETEGHVARLEEVFAATLLRSAQQPAAIETLTPLLGATRRPTSRAPPESRATGAL